MLAVARSCAVSGINGVLVDVEVKIASGMAAFTIAEFSDADTDQAKGRVRGAIRGSGFLFPFGHITVNLIPSELSSADSAYDLPIAIGILLASGQINFREWVNDAFFLGELSYDGSVIHTNGILPRVKLVAEQCLRTVFVPAVDAVEASLVEGMTVYPVDTIEQLVAHLNGEQPISPFSRNPHSLGYAKDVVYSHDMATVRGYEHVKRVLEIAASGGHHTLLSGAPGSGKSMLARTLPSILPPMTIDEALEITSIYSVSGLLSPQAPLILHRPFRTLHQMAIDTGMVSDGTGEHPSNMVLAHHGVLYLDELSTFERDVLEVLRYALDVKEVTISQARGMARYPVDLLLVAAMRPCPCGSFTDPVRECTCTAKAISRYHKRISRRLLDCIDIFVEVPRVDSEKLTDKRQIETSETISLRVRASRERQVERLKGTGMTHNAEMGQSEVEKFCKTDASGRGLLKAAMQQLHLPDGAYHRVLKLARTIADLAANDTILANHIAEAIQYRPRVEL